MASTKDVNEFIESLSRDPKYRNRLTAGEHIARLSYYTTHLMKLASDKKKKELIKELRGFRADTSWLIHQLEQDKCEC